MVLLSDPDADKSRLDGIDTISPEEVLSERAGVKSGPFHLSV